MNPTTFMIDTGSAESDWREVVRYQQYYQACNMQVSAQPRAQGGYLLSICPPPANRWVKTLVQPFSPVPEQITPRPSLTKTLLFGSPQPVIAVGAPADAPQTKKTEDPAPPQGPAFPANVCAEIEQLPPQAPAFPVQVCADVEQPAAHAPVSVVHAAHIEQSAESPSVPFRAHTRSPWQRTALERGGASLLRKLRDFGAVTLIFGTLGLSPVFLRAPRVNRVTFENSLDVPGELSLNGQVHGVIQPRNSVRLELEAGSYAVSFKEGERLLDRGTLVVPKGTNTLEGYAAIYNLGGKKGIAVATKYYGGDSKDTVRFIKEGTRLIELPEAPTFERIDDAFPESIVLKRDVPFGSVTRVCHVDVERETLGCPGW